MTTPRFDLSISRESPTVARARHWGGQHTIADIAIFPWVRALGGFYEAAEKLALSDYPKVMAHLDRCAARPAAAKGLVTPAMD